MEPDNKYDILAIPATGDVESSSLQGWPESLTPGLARVATWSWYCYACIRLFCLISSTESTWEMWAVLLAEYIFMIPHLSAHALEVAASQVSSERTPKNLRLVGDQGLPLVDILVTSCGEALDIILSTVKAACLIDYPTLSFRVTVLDDGCSPILRGEINKLRATWPNLHYLSRGRKTDMHIFSKAANLNYGLAQMRKSNSPVSEFVAVLDADTIPAPEFLRATLPHVLREPNLAVVSTMPYIYNVPTGDPLRQGMGPIAALVPMKTRKLRQGVLFGSGHLIRHRLLERVQGYPTVSFAEDMMLASLLRRAGFDILSIPEPLQFGLTPTTFEGYAAQRKRWILSLVQFTEAVTTTSSANTLPTAYRWPIALQGVAIALHHIGVATVSCILPVVLARDSQLVPTPYLRIQVVLSVVHMASLWLYEWLSSVESGYRMQVFDRYWNLALNIGYAYRCLRYYFCCPTYPGGRSAKGSLITGSTLNPWNSPRRPSRLEQLRRDIFDSGAWVNLVYLLGFAMAMGHSVAAVFESTMANSQTTTIGKFLAGVGWPPILHICYLLVCSHSTLIICVLFPLAYPESGSLLGPHPADDRAVFPTEQVRHAAYHSADPALGKFGHVALVPLVLASLLGLSFYL